MRGKGRNIDFAVIDEGITPAYAGKRLETASLIVRNQDHPRLCGEKLSFPLPIVEVIGSPPPMRGKVVNICILRPCWRITPAYAGKRPLFVY